jgi:release factor glutamine methyltransferase
VKNVLQLLREIHIRLMPMAGNIDLARVDAETIIEHTLNISRTQLYAGFSRDVDSDELALIELIVGRRLRGEPLQYILEKAYFYDRFFFVDTNVLIPRPDTETLVEAVINTEKDTTARFIDIGTGSGIIAATLTAHRAAWTAIAVDISYKALQTASRNIINERCKLACCDMFGAIKPENQFDFIVSNPPYISSPQMSVLDKSVINHEPHAALHGGADGLDFYRVISDQAKMYLKDSGRIYLEIGYDQGESVPQIFRNDGGWGDITIIKDLGGKDRVVMAARELLINVQK